MSLLLFDRVRREGELNNDAKKGKGENDLEMVTFLLLFVLL